MVLPVPVWSDNDIKLASEAILRNPSSLIWKTWSKEPTKFAVLLAMASCQTRLAPDANFGWNMTGALAQKYVCFLHSYLLEVEEVTLFRSL